MCGAPRTSCSGARSRSSSPSPRRRVRPRLRACSSEARALAAVRHPSVVALYDVLTGAWGTALVLEVLPGETLAARLSRDGPVSAPIAISVAMQLAAALEAVHQVGLVHRDVKPGNVIIRPDGAVRLIDFGIARPAGDRHGLTPAGKVEGTLRSISPSSWPALR